MPVNIERGTVRFQSESEIWKGFGAMLVVAALVAFFSPKVGGVIAFWAVVLRIGYWLEAWGLTTGQIATVAFVLTPVAWFFSHAIAFGLGCMAVGGAIINWLDDDN